ncbi:MAG TPA: hypothetical protein VEH86_02590 [Candidatus Acidoferrum sp.]|nr:hypothetical protein [Candidatus Acidoferrum sp.]
MSTKSIAFIGVFAAFHVTLYLISPPVLWRNWAIYLAPIEGIILGPWAGFSAALIGSTIGRIVIPTPFWMFGIVSEPLSVLAAGFLVRKSWRPVVAIYAAMFVGYFATPLGRELPVWPLLDAIIALCLVYPAAKLSKNLFGENVELLPISLAIVSFITVTTDGLARVFLLIPAGLYSVLGMTQDMVLPVFVGGGIDSFVEDALVILVSVIVGVPIVLTLRKVMNLKKPLN